MPKGAAKPRATTSETPPKAPMDVPSIDLNAPLYTAAPPSDGYTAEEVTHAGGIRVTIESLENRPRGRGLGPVALVGGGRFVWLTSSIRGTLQADGIAKWNDLMGAMLDLGAKEGRVTVRLVKGKQSK